MCEGLLTFCGVDIIAARGIGVINVAKCAACVLVNIAGDKGGKETQFFLTIITLNSAVTRYVLQLLSILTVVKKIVEKKCKFPVINLPRGDVIAST
jgi:hypothetical protein